MTVASEIRKSDAYVGNGIATEFVFPFKVFLASDVQVVVADELGAESVLELDAAYEVELNENQNADPGGTVVLFDPLPDGHTLVITSDIPELQPVDLANQGGFYPSVVTAALDRLTILVQQLRERLSRAAVLPITSDADADTLVSSILVISGIQQQLADIAANLSSIAAAGAVADEIVVVAGISTEIQAVSGLADAIGNVAAISTEIQAVSGNLLGILAAEQAAIDAAAARDAAIVAQGLAEGAAAAAATFDPDDFVPRAGNVTISERIAINGSVRFPPSTSSAGTVNVSDQSTGAIVVSAAGTTTINVTLSTGGSLLVSVKSNGHAVTIPSVQWVGGVTPTIPASGRAVFVIWEQEGTVRGFKHGEYAT